MKKLDSHIEENDLDILLRQLVLDGGDDTFTQNLQNMNADFIFNRSITSSPDAARELAMIQQLEKTFVPSNRQWKFWLNGILLILVFACGIWIYKMNSGDGKNTSQNSSPQNNFSPTVTTNPDTSISSQNATTAISASKKTFVNGIDSTTKEDTTHETKIPHKEKDGMTDTHMPIEKNWYDGMDPDTMVGNNTPGPIFTAKASPENYKLMQGNFEVAYEYDLAYSIKQDSFSAPYYTGEPFKSGMNDMQYFNFGDYAQRSQVEAEKKDLRIATTASHWIMPYSILEYADANEVKQETVTRVLHGDTLSHDWLFMYKIPERGIEIAMNPFYFRKYEVTNKEYREFVNWVRASNGYANKPICNFRIDTALVTDSLEWGGEELTIKGKKYRIRRISIPTENYKDVYNYVFFNQNADAVKQLGKKSLYIFPDTAVWTKDFTFSYNEPMTNYYFWHPAYDNYPVVGVSWYQAMAFLDWKTHFHQKQLDAENIPYEIEYTLPSDIHWELASVSLPLGKNVGFKATTASSQDWMTNLAFSYPGHDDPFQSQNYLKNMLIENEHYPGDYISDGYFHTGPADLSSMKKNAVPDNTTHLDEMGISWMDGNVSEWMMETYAQNWKPFFEKHLSVLATGKGESTEIAKQIEMLYDKGNAANGRLVRGANWYDERFCGRPLEKRNDAGISPKRFIDPSEQHCTIGFRYVVLVKRK